MSPDLLVDIVAYKNYFFIISGISEGRLLTVLDIELNIISELEFLGIEMWGAEFHIDEKESKILISVTTTEAFSLEKRKYQGYNTLWYELKENSNTFNLQLIDKWKQSDIKAIKSKIYRGKRIWLALKELNSINQEGHRIRSEIIGLSNNTMLNVPQFEYYENYKHSYLSQNIGIEINDNNIFISGIGNQSNTTPTLLKIDRKTKSMEFLELKIPLKKLHCFHDTIIKKINNQFYSYFWITSSEYCKEYIFQIFVVKIEEPLTESTFKKALESDYVHSFTWANMNVAYQKDKGATPCWLGKLSENGEIIETNELGIAHPILLTNSNEIIALTEDRKRIIKLK